MLGDGQVQISHHGRVAGTLRDGAAVEFLRGVEGGNPQHLIARLTVNYKRGDEKIARVHPRNRGR